MFSRVFELLQTYAQAGLAVDFQESKAINQAWQNLPERPTRSSNDQHVLALAVACNASLLISCDKALCRDFLDRNVMPEPQLNASPRKVLPGLETENPVNIKMAKRTREFLARNRCQSSK